MEFTASLHPAEIIRLIRSSFNLFALDQDLRFPHNRKRLALEIRLEMKNLEISDSAFKSMTERLLKEFEAEEAQLSIIEIWILWEWNERYRQISSLLKIAQMKKRLTESPKDPVKTRILERINEIEFLLKSDPLEVDPAWYRLPLFRWKFAGIPEELEYFNSLL